MLRAAARAEGDQGGGYRSRGPVLWMMRVGKLCAWFDEHYPCGEWVGHEDEYRQLLARAEAGELDGGLPPWGETDA